MKRSISARIAIKGSAFLSDARVLYGFKLLLTLAFLVWLWDYWRTQPFTLSWGTLHAGWLALAIALVPVNIVFQFLKWHLLLRCAQPQSPPQVSLYSLFAGFPLGLLTPGRWGELARAMYVPRLPREEVFVLSAIDKVHALLVNAWLGSLALIYLMHKNLLPGRWQWLAALSIVVFSCLNALLFFPALFLRWRNLPRPFGCKGGLASSGKWQMTPPGLIAIYLLSFLFVVTYCLQMAAFVRCLVAVELAPAWACAAAIFFLKSALPVTLGELGVREGMAVFFFAGLQVPEPAALQASLLLFFFNLVLPALVGVLWIWKRKNEEPTCL